MKWVHTVGVPSPVGTGKGVSVFPTGDCTTSGRSINRLLPSSGRVYKVCTDKRRPRGWTVPPFNPLTLSPVGRRDTGIGTRDTGVGRRDTGVGRRGTGIVTRDTGIGARDTGAGRRDTGIGTRDTGVGRRVTGAGGGPAPQTLQVGGTVMPGRGKPLARTPARPLSLGQQLRVSVRHTPARLILPPTRGDLTRS